MKKHTTPLALVASITFAVAQKAASTLAPAMVGTKKTPQPVAIPEYSKSLPAISGKAEIGIGDEWLVIRPDPKFASLMLA